MSKVALAGIGVAAAAVIGISIFVVKSALK